MCFMDHEIIIGMTSGSVLVFRFSEKEPSHLCEIFIDVKSK